MKADIAEILRILAQDVDKIESMSGNIQYHLVRSYDQRNAHNTGEKTITLSWSYIDPDEREKFVKWLQGDDEQ